MRTPGFVLCFASLLALAAPAWAAAKPEVIASVIKAEQPYGSGSKNLLFFSVYDASFWTDAPRWTMQTPFALSLVYHMAFSTSQIVDRSTQEMKHDNPALTDANVAAYGAEMTRLFPPVKAGDRLTGLYEPDGTTEFFLNGQSTGAVHGAAFARAFFGIWLSPQTSEPGLRAELLHLKP